MAKRTIEKLEEIKTNFPLALALGSGVGELYKELTDYNSKKINTLIQTDFSINFLKHNNFHNKIVADEENLPFKSDVFDIVISNFSLVSINRLHDTFATIYRILKTNGATIISIPTFGTLENLSNSLFETEMTLYKGVSPRVHPFTDIKTIANFMQEVGFKEITADTDKIEIMYKNFRSIFKDLKNSGRTNILTKRDKRFLKKNFLNELEKNFSLYQDPNTKHYPVVVSFCNIVAWK